MAHTNVGFDVINKFITEITPFGHPDFPPKLIGRGINVMISPLPRNKRAKNPRQLADGSVPMNTAKTHVPDEPDEEEAPPVNGNSTPAAPEASIPPTDDLGNTPTN